jgi:hypothetical protein
MSKHIVPRFMIGQNVALKGVGQTRTGTVLNITYPVRQLNPFTRTRKPLYLVQLSSGAFRNQQLQEWQLKPHEGPLTPADKNSAVKRGAIAGFIAGVIGGQA